MKYVTLLAKIISDSFIKKLLKLCVSVKQEETSKKTSVSTIAKTFKRVVFKPNTINLDYGGGRYDKATEYLKTIKVTNLVFDPFNRKFEHNKKVLEQIKENNGADTVTCNNVLNVIKEDKIRQQVIQNCFRLLKPHGIAYFSIYEGDKSGVGKKTGNGYQLNRVTESYQAELEKVFSNITLKNKIFICKR